MHNITKRHIIKIPKDISLYYCTTNHIVIFTNSVTQKALKLKTKLVIEKDKKLIISVLGYETQTLKQAEFMNIELTPKLYELNDVVVFMKKQSKYL